MVDGAIGVAPHPQKGRSRRDQTARTKTHPGATASATACDWRQETHVIAVAQGTAAVRNCVVAGRYIVPATFGRPGVARKGTVDTADRLRFCVVPGVRRFSGRTAQRYQTDHRKHVVGQEMSHGLPS